MARRRAPICARNLIKHEFSSQLANVEDIWSLFANARRGFTCSLSHAEIDCRYVARLSQCPNFRPFRELEEEEPEDFPDSRRGFASVNARSLVNSGFVARCRPNSRERESEEESRKPLASRHRGATVAHLKERGFDDIIEREKKLSILLRIKDLIAADPARSMTLLDLGSRKGDIGLDATHRPIAFLKRFPGVFRIHETPAAPWFHLTPTAEAILDEEVAIREGMEEEVVVKLRKLLMMASGGALPLAKIAHLERDLGLFRKEIVFTRPRDFRVVDEGATLELVRWNENLAVTEAERRAQEKPLEFEHDKRHRLSKFEELECPSPYEDGSQLHHRSLQFEKRAVLVVEELLSLTLEKRLLVDHLTHFRKEFNFSNKVYGMLIRHPDYFYVSRKGSRDTVFLRRAFEEVHAPEKAKHYRLIHKHPLVLVKEKFADLMDVDYPLQPRPAPAHGAAAPAQKTNTPW